MDTEFPYYKVYFKLRINTPIILNQSRFPYYKVYFKREEFTGEKAVKINISIL